MTQSERTKAWRKRNPEKYLAGLKKWRENNPEKMSATNKKWRKNNPDKIAINQSNRKRRQRERKAYLVALAGGKCIKCGYSKSLFALQFHHINPNEKEGEVSLLSLEKQIEEIKKCILLCANCHFELHEELNGE